MTESNLADAAAGSISLPMTPKRKTDTIVGDEPELKKIMTTEPPATKTTPLTSLVKEVLGTEEDKKEDPIVKAIESELKAEKIGEATSVVATSKNLTKAREIRLEQNRKAARESRRRKKVMIEELQRSVIFFSRANSTLKSQNEELSRLLLQAQAQVKASTTNSKSPPASEESTQKQPATPAPAAPAPAVTEAPTQATNTETLSQQEQQAQAQAVATQALFETQGFPAAAARAAAQTMNAANPSSTTASGSLPQMQPGATMQAMANFQQAAAAAMQAAIQGMQTIPNINVAPMTTLPPNATAQQAYTDQMTALAMQQAAAAHIGQQMVSAGLAPGAFLTQPILAWPTAAQPAVFQQVGTPAPAPAAAAEETKDESGGPDLV